MPRQFAALMWFGVDDSSTTVRFPIYGSATAVPDAFYGKDSQDGVTAPMLKFTTDHAFYVFNLVANWAYSRWDLIYPDVLAAINAKEKQYQAEIKEVDQKVTELVEQVSMDAAIEYATSYSVKTGNQLVKDWFDFFGQLFVKYRDGFIITSVPEDRSCGCDSQEQGYPQGWYDHIARDTKGHYLLNPNNQQNEQLAKTLSQPNLSEEDKAGFTPIPKSEVLKNKNTKRKQQIQRAQQK
jgi:hypothetical protein